MGWGWGGEACAKEVCRITRVQSFASGKAGTRAKPPLISDEYLGLIRSSGGLISDISPQNQPAPQGGGLNRAAGAALIRTAAQPQSASHQHLIIRPGHRQFKGHIRSPRDAWLSKRVGVGPLGRPHPPQQGSNSRTARAETLRRPEGLLKIIALTTGPFIFHNFPKVFPDFLSTWDGLGWTLWRAAASVQNKSPQPSRSRWTLT